MTLSFRSTFVAFVLGLTAVCAASGQTASLVEDIAAQEVSSELGRVLPPLRTLGEWAFFLSYDPGSGTEPWGTDGSVPGTRMLADTCPGGCGEPGEILGRLNGRLLWFDGRIWSTDGTPSGTAQLTPTNLRITSRSGVPDSAFSGGHLFFHGCLENATGQTCSLWRTNGTQAGTRRVPASNGTSHLAAFLTGDAGRVFFLQWNTTPARIWAADANGARPVLNVPSGTTVNLWAVWENRLFFTRADGRSRELWVTDGTAGGTRSLASVSGGFYGLLTTGSRGIYFIAENAAEGQEIWQSDGTPRGTRRITRFNNSAPFSLPEPQAFEIGDRLLFGAADGVTGRRVWSTTGTPQSTRAVSEPFLNSSLVRAGDRLFFYRYRNDAPACEIWSVDGTGTSTRLASGPPQGLCVSQLFNDRPLLQPVGNQAWFVLQDAAGWGVWRSDGTAQGTVRLFSMPQPVTDLAVSAGGHRIYLVSLQNLWTWDADEGLRQVAGGGVRNASSLPTDLTPDGEKLLFSTCVSGAREIWTSQGTAADTSLRAALGGTCEQPLEFTRSGSSFYFLRHLFGNARDLWKLDESGPVQLTPGLENAGRPVAFRGGVWFPGPNGEIWKSDGTPAGTGPALTVQGEPLRTSPFQPPFGAVHDGSLYYFAMQADGTWGLWRTDGQEGGWSIRLTTVSSTSDTFEMVRAGSTLFLVMNGGLWKTDGTPEGTVHLTRDGSEDLFLVPSHLVAHGGALYLYGANAELTEFGLWRTDGTPEGTWLVAPYDKSTGFPPEGPRPVSLGGRLFFLATDEEHGTELWSTDGTPAGTALVADVHPGPDSSSISELIVSESAGGAVWFAAQDPVHGRELWRTDGTAAGTRLVQDIAPEGLSSNPRSLTVAGDRLYFSADDGITGEELWSLPLSGPAGCQSNDTTLCLRDGRFQVQAHWRDFEGHQGVGRAVPLTGDTGTFWFFDPSNVEVLLKVLDGRGLNDHFWVFFGALSSVEYSLTVTDTQTGFSRRYMNPSGQLASAGDTEGFGPRGAHSASPDLFLAPPSPAALVSARTEPAAATGSCQPGPRRLCLNGGRFAVESSWKDFQGNTGQGTAVPFTADTGWFWFFDPANVEVMLKVLDGTALNGRFWVFFGALSNVEYELTVTETHTGAVKQYRNPSGRFASVADTGAF